MKLHLIAAAPFALAALFAIAPAVVDSQPADAAAHCWGQTHRSGEARSTSLSRAKQRARVKWRAGVNVHYGSQYNNWANASGRDYDVSKRFRVYKVRAKARPCKK